jgi:hypothetical protein
VEVATAKETPIEALTLYPRSAVTLTKTPVTIGLSNGDQVEIRSGLTEEAWVVLYSAVPDKDSIPTQEDGEPFNRPD